jgi:hypothetical protein
MKNKASKIPGATAFILCYFACLSLSAQSSDNLSKAFDDLKNRGEVILRFVNPPAQTLNELSLHMSIDKRNGDTIVAYVNDKQFKWFLSQNIPFDIVARHLVKKVADVKTKSTATAWSDYPSYDTYLQMMESFAENYPGLCKLQVFGTSVNGRKLMAVKISDNPEEDEAEPVFFYTSTIHGDEGLGYVLLLRLIDSLLVSYDSNPAMHNLIDSTEIWINPLFNPDGFYFGSDSFLIDPTRFNANNIDLNRNFPDPVSGDHPDGNAWQPETIAMIAFMKRNNIVLAANLHDGTEVVNYPWDSRAERHADDVWYSFISREFADTVHQYSPAGFFTTFDDGITDGWDWYPVHGGRQDYVNYFLHGREVTIELSDVKSPDPSNLPAYWNYYKHSLIGYMMQIKTGIYGAVTDSVTGLPIEARIEIPGYDNNESEVFSSASTGEFYRLLKEGSYDLSIASPGYITKTLEVSLGQGDSRHLSVGLIPSLDDFLFYPCPFNNDLNFVLPEDPGSDVTITLYDITGRQISSRVLSAEERFIKIAGLDWLADGIYLVKVAYGSRVQELKVIKIKVL